MPEQRPSPSEVAKRLDNEMQKRDVIATRSSTRVYTRGEIEKFEDQRVPWLRRRRRVR